MRLAAALLATLALAGCGGAPIDLVIEGGLVADGAGGEPFVADVVVDRGRIVAVGDASDIAARRRIDAHGLVVAPGFVDMHSHADLILLAGAETRQRLLEAKIRQGVTTIVVGNCGLGAAPANDDAAAILAGVNAWMTPDGVAAGAMDVASYLARLERDGVPVNVGTLVPHGPVRISAMGLTPGAPNSAQIESMRQSVRSGLDAGALGLSVGLIYPPGMFSETGELATLARVVAERDALFTAHIRGSSELLLPATAELLELARESGARVHHSHLEAVGEPFWPGVAAVLALEDAARAEGLAVSHDVFPYTRAATMMSAIFPPWSLEDGVEGLLERLRDPATRERVRHDIETRVPEWPPWTDGAWPHNLVEAVGWGGIRIASAGESGEHPWVGRDLADLGRELARDPFEIVVDLMLEQDGRVGQLVDEISGEAALDAIVAHPAAVVVSDAEDYGRGRPHPAHAGAFARVLRLVREGRLLPLGNAVRRMTSRPAELLRLTDRGVVRRGAWADLVVFDPRHVADRATWERPREPADGIGWVIVNGAVAVDDGRFVGGLHGAVLRATGGG